MYNLKSALNNKIEVFQKYSKINNNKYESHTIKNRYFGLILSFCMKKNNCLLVLKKSFFFNYITFTNPVLQHIEYVKL